MSKRLSAVLGGIAVSERGVSGLLALMAAVFALASFAIFVREYKSFYAGAAMRPQDYVITEGAFAARPVGLGSIAREVERCFAARSALAQGVLRAEVRARGYRACLDLADAVLLGSPLHGGALQLRAEMLQSLSLLGGDSLAGGTAGRGAPLGPIDLEAAIAAQVAAAQAAPNTVWLMQRRLLFVLALPDPGDARLAGMVAQDLPKLFALDETRRWLAQVYLRQPALRPMLAAREGQIMAGDLAAFLALVKSGARAQRAAP